MNVDDRGDVGWSAPKPLFEELPEFPAHILPRVLRDFVVELADSTQVPVDLAAMMALAAVATATQRSAIVRIRDRHTEPTCLYLVTVLGPGERKSSTAAACARPLREWEKSINQDFVDEISAARSKRSALVDKLKQSERALAKTDDQEQAAELTRTIQDLNRQLRTPAPSFTRLLAEDLTVEALAQLLQDQHGYLAVHSAEAGIFDIAKGRYSQGAPNFDLFLKAYSGEEYRVDRRHAPPMYIASPALTLGLAVQPSVLRDFIADPAFRNRGLVGRFLFSTPRSLLGFRNMDAPGMNPKAQAEYNNLVKALLRPSAPMPPALVPPERKVLSMSPEAQQVHREYERWLEPRLGPGGELHEFTDWAAKSPGQAARLAAIFHLVDGAFKHGDSLSVSGSAASAAYHLMREYFIPHAIQALSGADPDSQKSRAQALLSWLATEGISRITVRDAHDRLRKRGTFKKADSIREAFDLLEAHGFVRNAGVERSGKSGRPPSNAFEVNPLGLELIRRPPNGVGDMREALLDDHVEDEDAGPF